MSVRAALAGLVLTAGMACMPAHASSEWVLDYEGKSSNALAWDQRTPALLRAHVPPPLLKDVLSGLRGPPDPALIVDGRYATMSACVPHACLHKGLFWIDSRRDAGIGAYFGNEVLMLGSKTVSPRRLPVAARKAILIWLDEHELSPKVVHFVTPGGGVPLDVRDFTPRTRFRPPPQGPSFDCARAKTRIEKTICAEPSLAAQDLQLDAQVRSLRLGWDTVGARRQVVEMQRRWLRVRDAQCGAAPDMAACLGEQYRMQHERLQHWLPRPE